MTRGYKPAVAIREAERKATAWGFVLIRLVSETMIPFDFAIHKNNRTSLVRVRRVKYASYGLAAIRLSCAREIDELRRFSIPAGISKELWVRGPDRTWHRYLVCESGIEVPGNLDDMQE
jgi:hypothetical protein